MTTLTPNNEKPRPPVAVPHIPVAARAASRSLRVLMISHTCQSPAEGQPKVRELLKFDDLDLRVIVPHRWKHYGSWREPQIDLDLAETVRAERVRFPWVGPAQSYLHRYPDLPAILDAFRPHVIDLWEEPWSAASAYAVRANLAAASPGRVICETEQNIEKKLPWPFEKWRRYSLDHADHLIGRSAEAVEVARRKGFDGNATVVPNGVDVELFHPRPDRDAIRASKTLAGFVIGFVGRLVEEKGVLDLVDALAGCDKTCNAVFVGSGPAESAILATARRGGVGDRVRIVPHVDAAELSLWMNAFDVLAVPSRTTARWKEQFGRVIAEAGACGRAVVAARSGAIPDVVAGAGILVPERDPPALAAACEALRMDPAKRQFFGEMGRRNAVERYGWSAVAKQMHAIYCDVASKAARKASRVETRGTEVPRSVTTHQG